MDLRNPDFVALAHSFGIQAAVAHDPEQLRTLLTGYLQSNEPALIHLPMGEVPSIWDLVRRPPSAGV